MTEVKTSDVLPVRSRVSWGAILAGAFVAFAVYAVLAVLGVALGITIRNRASAETLGTAAGIWVAGTMLVSLFAGGCVSSRCTAGETKTEAIFYGVLVWGVFLAFMSMFAVGVAGAGITAAVGMANSPAVQSNLSKEDMRQLASESGYTQDQIKEMESNLDKMREKLNNLPEIGARAARDLSNDPRTTAAAWWTFVGLILSIGTAVCGAIVGSGPDLMTAAVRVRTTAAVVAPEPPRT